MNSSITVPSTINNCSIGDGVFKCCQHLEFVTIEDGIEVIGEEAFAECKKFKKSIYSRQC